MVLAAAEFVGMSAEWENSMRRLLTIGTAAAVGLWAGAAFADQTTGTITKIDLIRNTFVVDGIYFTAAPSNTVGVKLSRLKEGDRVTVQYGGDWADRRGPVNAMVLKKVS
jgi:hypothetical protein